MLPHLRLIAALMGGLLGTPQGPVPGRADTTATVAMRVEFRNQTALHVSTSQLRFDVSRPNDTSAASIEFTAAARTRRDGDVLLTVQPVGDMQAPDGASSAGLVVGYQGEGHNSGTLADSGPHVVGAWMGSGVRPGRVMFTLLGAHTPGVYSMSLKFVLSAP
jgi:hypothetical protein